jgi:hypothetical protein
MNAECADTWRQLASISRRLVGRIVPDNVDDGAVTVREAVKLRIPPSPS